MAVVVVYGAPRVERARSEESRKMSKVSTCVQREMTAGASPYVRGIKASPPIVGARIHFEESRQSGSEQKSTTVSRHETTKDQRTRRAGF
jgi:hypothetical protein